MFRPNVQSELKKLRTDDNDPSIACFVTSETFPSFLMPKEDKEYYQDLDRLRNYIKRIFDIDPVMARSYKAESEKANFSLCIHGRYFKDMEDRHPLIKYFSNYPGLEISQEKQLPSNVWIFSFPKNQCAEILKGIKLLDLDFDQLEALSKESRSKAAFC
jgi:hypothetical protein